jgi:hypothetical protein
MCSARKPLCSAVSFGLSTTPHSKSLYRVLRQAYPLQTADCSCDSSLDASRESTFVLDRDYAGHPHWTDYPPDHPYAISLGCAADIAQTCHLTRNLGSMVKSRSVPCLWFFERILIRIHLHGQEEEQLPRAPEGSGFNCPPLCSEGKLGRACF